MEINKKTYSELVVDYVKKNILNGTYKPGSKVKELVLAKKLSISRAPIREALQILIKEGLVVWIPQKGKFIPKLNPEQIKNSYFTGGILEAAAVSSSLHLYSPADIKRLDKIVDKMHEVAENNKPIETIVGLDDKFHKVLFSRIKNELLIEFSKRSCQGLSKFLFFDYWITLYSTYEVYMRHKAIVDAMKKGDTMELELCIRHHYIDAGERMSANFQELTSESSF